MATVRFKKPIGKPRRHHIGGTLTRRSLQREGIERVIAALERATPDSAGMRPAASHTSTDHTSDLSRLRVAHAAYALASSPMLRKGPNAWMRRRGQ